MQKNLSRKQEDKIPTSRLTHQNNVTETSGRKKDFEFLAKNLDPFSSSAPSPKCRKLLKKYELTGLDPFEVSNKILAELQVQ